MADQRTGMIRFAAAPGEPLPPSPARILSSGLLIPTAGHGRLSMNRGVANPINHQYRHATVIWATARKDLTPTLAKCRRQETSWWQTRELFLM